MASKRPVKRPSPSRSKRSQPEYIALAKRAKAQELISKRANLHSGKFISRGVLRRVEALRHEIEAGFVGRKAPRKLVRAAKEQGMITVGGNRIVTPSARKPEGRRMISRLKKGQITGVHRLRHGHLQQSVIPVDFFDLRKLLQQYKTDPSVINSLKGKDEQFGFKLYGNDSYKAFRDIQHLMNYLFQYDIFGAGGDLKIEALEDLHENFQVFKISPFEVETYEREGRIRENIHREHLRRRQEYLNRRQGALFELRKLNKKERRRIAEKQRRDRMSEKEKEEYRRKARERAARRSKYI